MPRKLSPLALQSALAQQTGEAWLFLLDVIHTPSSTHLRWVNDTQDLVHGGNTYKSYPFDLQMTLDDEEHMPSVAMVLDNVDRPLMTLIRTSTTAPEFEIRIVLASQPDTVEVEVVGLTLLEVTYDVYGLYGTLYPDDLLSTRYPRDVISIAGGYQGLFRQ
jgi:hypothetical protein